MQTEKGLSAWQLTMMALGTVIGGSFFLGSSVAIHAAGPSVIISYVLGGVLVYIILFALSEMTVANPAPGSFRTFAEKAYGPAAGFIVGWVYWTGLVLAMSSEAIAASILMRTWLPSLSIPLLGSIIVTVVSLINLLGADKLSKIESSLAIIKLFAIVGFVILALLLISGLSPWSTSIGAGALATEPWFPGSISGIAGSMLIVMFAYAGFEIIGLAASEARNPSKTIPQAITYTVLGLVGLYIAAILTLLPLIATYDVNEDVSPFVAALTYWNLNWASSIITVVLVTAILSTMLAAMFGLARMARSLADKGHAPAWLKDKGDIPYRSILFSGAAMLSGIGMGFFLPKQVYLFLVSSGGFSLLFAYIVILATHYKFRRLYGCPPNGNCQLPGYPYTSWFAMVSIAAILVSMPLVSGQAYGLFAGIILVLLFGTAYYIKSRLVIRVKVQNHQFLFPHLQKLDSVMETSEELTPEKASKNNNKND